MKTDTSSENVAEAVVDQSIQKITGVANKRVISSTTNCYPVSAAKLSAFVALLPRRYRENSEKARPLLQCHTHKEHCMRLLVTHSQAIAGARRMKGDDKMALLKTQG